MTQPIIKGLLYLHPVEGVFPTTNYTITRFAVRAMPRELDTTVSLFLNDVLAATVFVETNATAQKLATYKVNTRFRLEPEDRVTYSITTVPPAVSCVSVTKYPTIPYPNWQTWQIGGPLPPWFAIGTAVILTAAADQSVVVRGTVVEWDDTTKKFRINLTELVGDVTPYNSWSMALDGGEAATVAKITLNCEYLQPEEPEEAVEDTPVVQQPEIPAKPKKRRIMM